MSHTSDVVTTTLATSHELRDRGSMFVGYLYRARTVEEARAVLGLRHGRSPSVDMDHVNGQEGKGESKDGSGPYVIAAWRCMVVKPGRTGLGGPDDFAVQDGCDDGGERWAGGRVLGVMQREGVIDAVVVVCRWFGGTLLGPVRFAHIETCAGEVCRRFKRIEEMDECVQTLKTLDGLLATLRAELVMAREKVGIQPEFEEASSADKARATRTPDYRAMQEALDLTKAKRLVHARRSAINATKILIEKCKTSG